MVLTTRPGTESHSKLELLSVIGHQQLTPDVLGRGTSRGSARESGCWVGPELCSPSSWPATPVSTPSAAADTSDSSRAGPVAGTAGTQVAALRERECDLAIAIVTHSYWNEPGLMTQLSSIKGGACGRQRRRLLPCPGSRFGSVRGRPREPRSVPRSVLRARRSCRRVAVPAWRCVPEGGPGRAVRRALSLLGGVLAAASQSSNSARGQAPAPSNHTSAATATAAAQLSAPRRIGAAAASPLRQRSRTRLSNPLASPPRLHPQRQRPAQRGRMGRSPPAGHAGREDCRTAPDHGRSASPSGTAVHG